MMNEYGEQFWGSRWAGLYDVLGGNPLAAMPSLHFATSLMGAHLLSEVGPVAGAFGWTYASTLGLALVYLGEHYAVDLIAGAALTETVRAARPAPRSARRSGLLGVASAGGPGERRVTVVAGDHAQRAGPPSRIAPDRAPGTRRGGDGPVGAGNRGDAAGGVHPPADPGLGDLRRLDRCFPVLRAAEGPRPAPYLEPDPARQWVVAGARSRARGVLVLRATSPLFRGVFAARQRARGSTGGPATRSRWPGWRRHGCSPQRGRAGSH